MEDFYHLFLFVLFSFPQACLPSWHHHIQHDDTRHGDTRVSKTCCGVPIIQSLLFFISFNIVRLNVFIVSVVLLAVCMLSAVLLTVFMLSVVLLTVFMLSVVLLNVFMLTIVLLNVYMLSVVLMNVIMLSVVAPLSSLQVVISLETFSTLSPYTSFYLMDEDKLSINAINTLTCDYVLSYL
jgi:hypothetical protein